MSAPTLLHRDITREVLRAFYTLHAELGCGFLEAVYANGLAVLLRESGLRVQREVTFDVMYRGHRIGRYRADLVVESRVQVEVKAARRLEASHHAQLLNCLRASECRVGLLLNFGAKREFRRVIVAGERDADALGGA